MNNKGFMMSEVVVVAAIVLGILTGIYTSYSKIFTRYSEVITYYNVDGIYKLANYRNEMIEADDANNINQILNMVDSSQLVVYANNSAYPGLCIFSKDNFNSLVNNPNSSLNGIIAYNNPDSLFYINQAYKDYLKYLSSSVSFQGDYIMTLEYSIGDDDDKKYYSYLELEA